ncbi:MAG: repressor LexA [Deltaproteobacteria bacterium]|nr:repressor LexA [Deltaproteobacteria bacterium]
MQGLTKRQEKVLDYITSSITERGYPPTLREIGRHMGIRSTNGVNDHLRALERKGYLKREDMKSRALRPVNMEDKKQSDTVKIPVVGRVTAGQPVLSEQNIEDYITVDRFLLGNTKEVFGMWVNGDAMLQAGIHNGDFIFVKKQMFAEKGDVVVALLGDNAAVRYYHPERDHIRFVPANSNCSPVMVRRQDFLPMQLLGVVMGVYRRL